MLFRVHAYPRRYSPSARFCGVTYKISPSLGCLIAALHRHLSQEVKR
jgi:hypothetical protein